MFAVAFFFVLGYSAWNTIRSMTGRGGGGEDPRQKVKFPQASYGQILPVVYGTTKVDAPAISQGDVYMEAPDLQKGQWKAYDLGRLLCQGPIGAVRTVWANDARPSMISIALDRLAACGLQVVTGNLPAPGAVYDPNSGLTVVPGTSSKRCQYPGVAHLRATLRNANGTGPYVDLKNMFGTAEYISGPGNLGVTRYNYPKDFSVGSLPPFSAEVSGFYAWHGPDNIDALPTNVLNDMLGSNYWALNMPGILETEVGADGTWGSSYSVFCHSSGFYVSAALTQQKAASQHIQELLDATDSVPFWSADGKLKIVPYCDEVVTGNGLTFTPNTTPIYDLDYSDFIASGDEPAVTMERLPDALNTNVVSVMFRDRYAANATYRPSIETVQDSADIDDTGRREGEPIQMDWIATAGHAQRIARLKLNRSLYVRKTYHFRLGWRFARLEPMDLVTLTDAKLGLSHEVVRIVAIEEDDEGVLHVDAVEWPFGIAGATLYQTQSSDAGAVKNQPPGDAEAPVVIPVPALLAGEQPAIWIGATGLSDAWGGCDVYLSADNAAFTFAGTINGRTRMGPLTADLATGTALDEAHTLAVDLTDSRGILSSTSDQGRDDLENLSVVVNAGS